MTTLAFADPAGAAIIGAGLLGLLTLLLDLAFLVLVIWALVVILKLPGLLERQASVQQQTHQLLREILVEIRSVTKAQQ